MSQAVYTHLEGLESRTGLPTEQNDDRFGLCGDESKGEDVFGAACVALESCLAQGAVAVQGHLAVLRSDLKFIDKFGTL